MFDRPTRPHRRTLELRERVRSLAPDHTPAEIAAALGVGTGVVYRALAALGIPPYRPPRPPVPDAVAGPILSLSGDRTSKEIAAEVGHSAWIVRKVLAAAGVTPLRRPIAPAPIPARMVELAPNHTIPEIAALVGRSPNAVREVLRRRGVAPKPTVRPAPIGPRLNKRLASAADDTGSPPLIEPLAVLRYRAGLTQAALADAVGVDHSTVSTWEGPAASRATPILDGRTDLAAVALAGKLARALDVDPRAISECRRAVRPRIRDLPAPPSGRPDRRNALLPFVRWLRLAMASRGWGVEDMAGASGNSPDVVALWARGKAFPQGGRVSASSWRLVSSRQTTGRAGSTGRV